MKLLNKNQITEVKNKERQLDIDQALGFARKVDELRETKATEEASLKQFRDTSLAQIKKEIECETLKRDSISCEVRSLEERKIEALKPLDEKEKALKDKEDALNLKENSINELSFSLSGEKRSLEIDKERTRSQEIQLQSKLDTAASELKEAKEKKSEASQILESADLKRQSIELELSVKSKEISRKEEAVLIRERDIAIKDTNYQKSLKNLVDRERAVNDKYATLLRTLERTNGNSTHR